MSDDRVRAEANAVRALKTGVERYAEQVRVAVGHARREVAAADRQAREAVERRRSEVQKREQELRHAEEMRRQCKENCGGHRQRVASCTQGLAAAKQSFDRARKAAQLTATAQSDLLKILQTTEATVAQHSSVASSALASLDAKLAELPKFGVGHAVHNMAAGTVVGVEIFGATMDLGRLAGNALQAANITIPLRDVTITEMVGHREDQERDHVIKQDFESTKRLSLDNGTEKEA